jgi:predicted transcriptional regulator
MWTIGVADRLRFPRFPSKLGRREMLAFAHILTGAATNNEFDIGEVNSRRLKPAVAPAVGADMEPAGLHLRKRLRLSHVRGPPQPTASALALLAHEPGLSIRTLAISVGLSHAGTVRLVDRLATEGLIERRGHATDGRARSLYLTAAGRRASTKVLNARDQIIAEGLSVLSNESPGRTS